MSIGGRSRHHVPTDFAEPKGGCRGRDAENGMARGGRQEHEKPFKDRDRRRQDTETTQTRSNSKIEGAPQGERGSRRSQAEAERRSCPAPLPYVFPGHGLDAAPVSQRLA